MKLVDSNHFGKSYFCFGINSFLARPHTIICHLIELIQPKQFLARPVGPKGVKMPRLKKQIGTPIGTLESGEQAIPEQAAETGTPIDIGFPQLALPTGEPPYEEPPYKVPPNFEGGQASGKDHDKEEMFREMMIAFREMAQTQRAMIKSIKNRLPNPESARTSPGNIRLNNHANSSTHQIPFE